MGLPMLFVGSNTLVEYEVSSTSSWSLKGVRHAAATVTMYIGMPMPFVGFKILVEYEVVMLLLLVPRHRRSRLQVTFITVH